MQVVWLDGECSSQCGFEARTLMWEEILPFAGPRSSFSLPPFHFYFYFRRLSPLPFSFIIYQFLLLLARSLFSSNLIQVPCLYCLYYSGTSPPIHFHLYLEPRYYIPRQNFIITRLFSLVISLSRSTFSFPSDHIIMFL
jgi:hypothetical protein